MKLSERTQTILLVLWTLLLMVVYAALTCVMAAHNALPTWPM